MTNSQSVQILVVDDEPDVRALLRDCFELENYAVIEAADGAGMRRCLKDHDVDLVTLDLQLGGEDGLTLAREIRSTLDVPIIMVTGKGDPIDRIVGLEIGADDYIAKPFHIREVLARVRSVLRRSEIAKRGDGADVPVAGAARSGHERYGFGGWILDVTSRALSRPDGGPLELTTAEFNLLELFVKRPHRALTRDAIMDQLKGHDWSPLDRSIDTLVARLRKKIDTDTQSVRLIKTVRGVGYMFDADVRRV